MSAIRYTLVANGGSDRALLSLVNWLLRNHLPERAVHPQWADLARLTPPPKSPAERIERAVDLYPCDMVFVHRDAERVPREERTDEIRRAIDESGIGTIAAPVVPVRMTEAWFLFDEQAIRGAADNPNGNVPLQLPPNPEELPDPKSVLHSLLKTASELSGRRLKKFRVAHRVHRVAQLIQDFGPLRGLPAFQAFEDELQRALRSFQSAGENP